MDPIFKGENVKKAYEVVKKIAHKTPVLTCSTLNEISKKQLFFKCENFQKIGAFKFRGACNAIHNFLLKDPSIKSVVTHSSGNHAQAVALGAKMFNLKAYIVMPENAPKVKVNAVKDSYCGNVIFAKSNPLSREQKCEEVKEKHKSSFIHPSDEPFVILGAGTCFYEFHHQLQSKKESLDAILMPIGGGGLSSGTAIASKYLNKNCKIFGAEPKGANDAYLSFKNKKHIKNPPGKKPPTLADGLLTNLVTDEQIVKAMRLVWERMKIVIEPSSAVPVAVALFNEDFRKLKLKKVGIIISGGNIDMTKFFNIIKEKCDK